MVLAAFVALANGQSISSVTAPATLYSGTSGPGEVQLSSQASANTQVALTGFGAIEVPASVTVQAGKDEAVFVIEAKNVSASAAATVKASIGSAYKSVNLTVIPATLEAIHAQPEVQDGAVGRGFVELDGTAGGNITVDLSSSTPDLSVDQSTVIPNGKSQMTFKFLAAETVTAATSATITAKLGGVSKTVNVQIEPANTVTLKSIQLQTATIAGGNWELGRVNISGELSSPAGVSVSSSSDAVTVPSTVDVGAGDGGVFRLTTTGVNAITTATITATSGSDSVSTTLTVTPATLQCILGPKRVTAGGNGKIRLLLNGIAGSNGVKVNLSSSSGDLQIASSATVAADDYSTTVSFTTSSTAPAETARITATVGSVTKSIDILIAELGLDGVFVFPKEVVGGTQIAVLVRLNGSADETTTVDLASDTTSVISVPAAVDISAGNEGGFVTVTTTAVTKVTTVVITATMNGVSKQFAVTVLPPPTNQ